MTRIRRGYVDTEMGQIHYRAAGSGPDVVVLLHQIASSSAMYEALMARLAPRFAVVAPDMPGFGASDPPARPAELRSYAQAVYLALRGLGVETCHVFGHHAGTSLAVQMEHDHRGLARTMVLSGPALLSPAQKDALGGAIGPVVPTEDGAHLLAMWQRIRAKDPGAPLALSQRETLLNLHAGEIYHDTYRAILEHDFAGQLDSVHCPVLVLAGEHDSLAGAVEPTAARLPRASVRILPGVGGYVCDRLPDQLGAICRELFERPGD